MQRRQTTGRRGPRPRPHRTPGHGPSLSPLALLALVPLTGCAQFGAWGVSWAASTEVTREADLPTRLVRTPDQVRVSVDEAADELAQADVIFLGEQHDSTAGHAVQLALTKAIAERRGEIILSMEMLERDCQRVLDMYLDGTLTEEQFARAARLWPNYPQHYRPAVEFARENGFDVVAANVYRPIAARVARRGLDSAYREVWAAVDVDVSDGEYRDRFDAVMGGGHGAMDSSRLDNIYAAQCIKDDTMAESIARRIASERGDAPPVVHWNGRFHSDFGLGTVERLRRRMPDLNIAVVSMITEIDLRRKLVGDEVDQGHFVILVSKSPSSEDE